MADIVKDGMLNEILKPLGQFREFPRKTVLIDCDGDYTYVGLTGLGLSTLTDESIWQILRVYESGNTTTVLWADGNDLFDNIWEDRATLTYS